METDAQNPSVLVSAQSLNLSMHIHHHQIRSSSFNQAVAKTGDNHCNLSVMYRRWFADLTNIHMRQKPPSGVVRGRKSLMMIKCDSCYTAIILSSINFNMEISQRNMDITDMSTSARVCSTQPCATNISALAQLA